MTTVGVVGLGTVGGTVIRAFEEVGIPTRGYDRYLRIGSAADLGD
jgi:phosphoglycerate dehydrogenase-like enzyme